MSETQEKSVWRPILPVPAEVFPRPAEHKARKKPYWTYEYRDLNGNLLGYEDVFFTSTGERLLLPLTWCEDQHGARGWRWIQFQRMRPIFGLDTLGYVEPYTDAEIDDAAGRGEVLSPRAAQLDLQRDVVICFDAHAAADARRLLPFAALSWPGGIKNIDDVDWALLRGLKNVWIWPPKTADRMKVRANEEGEGLVMTRDKQSAWKAVRKLEAHLVGFGVNIVGVIDPFSDDDV
ncbi:MAG TPA: hypothetical protein VL381_00530, partial [Rhodocyclaceae bacterium]|nr:hypothetical protein [Rhodocyclaceae bacterium]